MKRFVLTLTNVVIILALLHSCDKESECDSKDFATPAMALVNPDDTVIEVAWDAMLEVDFSVQAEGGLNTVTMIDQYMYERPITAFVNGETEASYKYSTYVYENMELVFTLFDLCNNASESIRVEVRIIEDPRM
jgi:hypothetical protein